MTIISLLKYPVQSIRVVTTDRGSPPGQSVWVYRMYTVSSALRKVSKLALVETATMVTSAAPSTWPGTRIVAQPCDLKAYNSAPEEKDNWNPLNQELADGQVDLIYWTKWHQVHLREIIDKYLDLAEVRCVGVVHGVDILHNARMP